MGKVVILSGAGISAESGIETFRGDTGLWQNHLIEDVATPEGFTRNPDLVIEFYNQRRRQLLELAIQPNPAHQALARLERDFGDEVIIVTQNIDNLHERSGSSRVIHMHGELLKKICSRCFEVSFQFEDMDKSDLCKHCGTATLRPHIVWFGEMPLCMDEIYAHLDKSTVFAAIGTSGQVYPAASFVEHAKARGAQTWEINLQTTETSAFDQYIYGKASETVVQWTDIMLGL